MPLDGYTKAWRKELESEVWLMPPLYIKVWYYLRHIVQWKPFLFPSKGKFGIWVLPGQRILSIRQIAEGVKWVEWGKEVIPNTKTISEILKWFEDREMIVVESNAKGTLITITNWDTYQGEDEEKVTRNGQPNIHALDTSEERIEGIRIKPKKPIRPPSGDHQFFIAYWRYAFKLARQEDAYLSGADQKAIQAMLAGGLKIRRMVLCAAYFLTSREEWLKDKKTISVFQTKIGGMPNSLSMDLEKLQDEKFIPPLGVELSNWKFWEVTDDNDCLHSG